MLEDIYHSNAPICQIVPTSTKKKEDVFHKYRPQPKTCLDYNISQTDAKLDAGDTKIHYQETVAEYTGLTDPPPPPKKKLKRFCSGGPPRWKFVDEIWIKKQLELQKQYKEELKSRFARKKRIDANYMSIQHKICMIPIGPSWYQELSPNQIRTVDKLKNCISKDLSEGTIINTQENIGELGLVLRPNHKHIKKALENCCNSPVEFLLVLYQLINPKRTKYSINDRLLLSAVVHLTMMTTLKELHIRIPSPPPLPVNIEKKPKKKKIVKYESPYLEPFTFKKEPPKYTGVYTNKHITRPQSPYFCYLKELNEMKQAAQNGTRETTKLGPRAQKEADELEEERKLAQSIYESLVDFRPVPVLLRATKRNRCDKYKLKEFLRRPEPVNEIVPEVETVAEEEIEEVEKSLHYIVDEQSNCDIETELAEEISGVCICTIEDASPCSTAKSKCCDKEETNQDRKEEERLRGGGKNEEPTCKHARDLEIYNKMYHLIRPSGGKEKKTCKCQKIYRDFVEKDPCQCEKCKEERHKRSINYIISGLKEVDRNENTTIIEGIAEEKPCTCLKKYNKAVEQYLKEKEEEAKRTCDCRKETEKLASKPVCPCARCEEDRNIKAAKFIIAGTKESEEDNLRIIEGTSTGKPCDCFKKYQKRVNQYEAFKESQKVVVDLKGKEDKYILDGISHTPQGPVYVISGLRPQIDCVCAKKTREEEAQKRMESIMPHVPRGRIQYGITGVKETPEGNIYMLGNALPIKECNCMAVYKAFSQQHTTCMKLYEDYMAQMKEEYNQFLEEMSLLDHRKPSEAEKQKAAAEVQKESEKEGEIGQVKQENEISVEKEDVEEKEAKVCTSCKRIASCRSCYYPYFCSCGNPYYSVCCQCGRIEEIDCQQCSCGGEVIQCVDCTCGPIEEEVVVEEETVEEEPIVEEKEKPKRYFIFDKISCNRKWQIKVLKKALKSMEEDGFALAKLPQAWRLPHFKLWMQMRCGQCWTLQDRYNSMWKSKDSWRHLDHCNYWKDHMPKLGITRTEGGKFNWSQARYVKRLIKTTIDTFYRNLKQNRVNFGREFFPSTFTYEFPFSSWRDCYFAYTPAKEEEALGKFIWKVHDYKNVADMKRFCCL